MASALRTCIAAALIPVLVLGPALAGKTAVLHAHDDEGTHGHLVERHHVDLVPEWHHELEHAPAASSESKHGEHEPAMVIHVPEVAGHNLPAVECTILHLLDTPVFLDARLTLVGVRVPSIRPKGPSPPPPRASRTHIAGLLLSSHALLI